MEDQRFTRNDGLMLSAISHRRKPDVEGWIGTIDYLDRWTMPYEEMRKSVERLQKSGLITYEKGRFNLSPLAKLLRRSKLGEGAIDWKSNVIKRLMERGYTEISESKYELSREEYDSALMLWTMRWAKQIK